MSGPAEGLKLSDLTAIFARRFQSFLLVLAAVMVAAIVVTALKAPNFSALSEVLIRPAAFTGTEVQSSETAFDRARDIQNELSFAKSDRVEDKAVARLGSDEDDIAIVPKNNADVIFFVASGTDAERVAAVSRAYAEAYVEERAVLSDEAFAEAIAAVEEQLRVLQDRLTELSGSNDLQREALETRRTGLFEQLANLQLAASLGAGGVAEITILAKTPEDPSSAGWVTNLTLALVLGSVLGAGLAMLREATDPSVTSPAHIRRIVGDLPVLGEIPLPRVAESSLFIPDRGATESFRSLAAALTVNDNPPRSILVTSASAHDGKSVVAVNLAVALSRAGATVVVVDADVRRPTFHTLVPGPDTSGVASFLAGDEALTVTREQVTGDALFDVVTSGGQGERAADLLVTGKLAKLVSQLSDRYELVIINTAPVLHVGDAITVSRSCEAGMLVVRAGETSSEDVELALERLQRSGLEMIGTVLTGLPARPGGVGYGSEMESSG